MNEMPSRVKGYKFKIGDRVAREYHGTLRHGTVVQVNQSYKSHMGEYLILYDVKWDDTGLVERGYMDIANGLQSEET